MASFHHGQGNGTPLQYSCLENPMDGGAWQAAVHGVAKSQIQPSDFTFTFQFHALEKEMATHSSVLAWRIPGMVEPDGLLSMGLHRVDTTEATQQQQQHLLLPFLDQYNAKTITTKSINQLLTWFHFYQFLSQIWFQTNYFLQTSTTTPTCFIELLRLSLFKTALETVSVALYLFKCNLLPNLVSSCTKLR